MFDADRPITNHSQDRLGRSLFAKYLARCMLDHQNPESLVIGLYGGWASGKTSLINLTIEELNSAATNLDYAEKPIILNFSPWSYSGQNQLIYGFFRRLATELKNCSYPENATTISYLIELYLSFFIPQIHKKKQLFKTNWFKKDKDQQKYAYSWESGQEPAQVKAEINRLLKKVKHKIIIIIDNVSRLEAKEINQIFQLVKSMADYSNTIYFLTFDKKQVINAMDKMHNGEGKEYVDKLIQLPFEVPPISKQDLENLLFDRLQKAVQLAPEGSWNESYWADIYYSHLKYFFNTCRDITRYINTLSFGYPRIKDVVNPIDYFALTAIEVFAPQVFYGIRENKDLFTDLINHVYHWDADKLAKEKARCDEIIRRTDKVSYTILQNLLLCLFPRLHKVYYSDIPFYHSEQLARKNHRICSPDMFDVYFRLSIPSGQIPESEKDTILSLVSDEESFAQALQRLNHDNKIIPFLDVLDGEVVETIPEFSINKVINALMDSADLFPEGKVTLLSLDTSTRIHRILHRLMRRFQNSEERFSLLQEAITKASKSLYIIIHELTLQSQEHTEQEDTYLPLEYRDLSPRELDDLQQLAISKIKYWAKIGRLAEHPKLLSILYAWKAWGKEEECRQYVEQIVAEPKSLLRFLGLALKEAIVQARTKLEKNRQWKKYLVNVTDFIPTQSVEPHAKAMFESADFEKLQEDQQLAILIFLDAINAKTVKVIPKTTI